MLAAAEIERRKDVCRQCPDFSWQPAFCRRECHRPDGAYCEPWAQQQWAARLQGQGKEPCELWTRPQMLDQVVIVPWVGEFGWLIVQHAHYVQWHPAARKVVCCAPGHECLFPSAAEFWTAWHNPIPDSDRWQGTAYSDRGAQARIYGELRPRLEAAFPDHAIVVPRYDCRWHMSDAPGFTFAPRAREELPAVDVVLGARRRTFAEVRNWPHWRRLAERLTAAGLTVGVVGRAETSEDLPAAARAWDHRDGDTAGSVDMLARCRLFVGVDSGMTHLAAVMSVPTLLLETPSEWTMIGEAQRANKSVFRRVSREHWDAPERVFLEVCRALLEADQWRERPVVELAVAPGPQLAAGVEAALERAPQNARLVLHVDGCAESDLRTLHPYRDRFYRVVCRRVGHVR